MNWQFLLAAVAFGVAGTVAVLTATGVLPRSTVMIDAWSAVRPTVPRRWLVVAFWSTLALPVAACGILLGTAGQVLSPAWNDVAQFLMWLILGVDAIIARRRFLLAVAIVFLAVSAYAVAAHV